MTVGSGGRGSSKSYGGVRVGTNDNGGRIYSCAS